MTLKALSVHLKKGGFNAAHIPYLQAVRVYTVDFNAQGIVQMLKSGGFDSRSELTGRMVGSVPEAVVYARIK
jgi:hypothetical protein